MRSLISVGLLATCGSAMYDSFEVLKYISDYKSTEPACYLPLDVVFLQDTTQSFTDDLTHVMSQIPSMIHLIQYSNPNSHFGVAEFKDKPYEPFGWPGSDYCYRLASSLSSDLLSFYAGYAQLYASGGDDLPESQYQGVMNAILDPAVNWRPVGQGEGNIGARIIIMSTDAVPHYEGDYSSNEQNPSWVPNPGNIDAGLDFVCNQSRYPTYTQFADIVLGSVDTFLAILTPNDDQNVIADWQWVNEGLLHQQPELYQFISNDSSDFIVGVLKSIQSITETVCATTTSEPSTVTTYTSFTSASTTTTHGDTFWGSSSSVPTTTQPTTTVEATSTTLVTPCTHSSMIHTSSKSTRPTQSSRSTHPTHSSRSTHPTHSSNCPKSVQVAVGGNPSDVNVEVVYRDGSSINVTDYVTLPCNHHK